MAYGMLGRTGLRVSRLSLGAMTFGAGSGVWGDIAGVDRNRGTRLVAMAVERGVNLIDTADVYTTNAIESLHMQLRQIIKARGHFWKRAMTQFALLYPERFNIGI
ncbi:aldo/keto reductase [Burkholderia multivorans]|uniref:aldo/keto reductase n=1 Tax=Burkholderia multivorans TaxID=87883 RepID=UPI0012D90043